MTVLAEVHGAMDSRAATFMVTSGSFIEWERIAVEATGVKGKPAFGRSRCDP